MISEKQYNDFKWEKLENYIVDNEDKEILYTMFEVVQKLQEKVEILEEKCSACKHSNQCKLK